jgi:hypothetical protein
MPQIIVTADRSSDREEVAVMLRERVSAADFESSHFASQLVERLGWAVGDAHEAERTDVDRAPHAGGSTADETPHADDADAPAIATGARRAS